MDINNNFNEEFYFQNMLNINAKKSNNNLRKIKLDEKKFPFQHKRCISNKLSSPNLFNNFIKDFQSNRKINSINNQNQKKVNITQNYLNNNHNYLKNDINNNALNNINSFIKNNNNYTKENSFANNNFSSKRIKDIHIENMNKLKKPFINSYEDIKKIKDDDSIDEDCNLSDLADELIKSFQKDKKKLNKSNSSKNNTKKQSNKIVSGLYKGNIPQNFTFKTLFVNNVCIVPMNSSFIGKNDKKKEVKNINYVNISLKKNINNSINNTDNDNTYYPKIRLYNNYINSKIINRQKSFSNKEIKNIENKQKKNIKMNKNYKTNNTEPSLLEYKSISYKNMYNIKNKKVNIFSDDKILKDNGFNEEYYYTTMDFSNFIIQQWIFLILILRLIIIIIYRIPIKSM